MFIQKEQDPEKKATITTVKICKPPATLRKMEQVLGWWPPFTLLQQVPSDLLLTPVFSPSTEIQTEDTYAPGGVVYIWYLKIFPCLHIHNSFPNKPETSPQVRIIPVSMSCRQNRIPKRIPVFSSTPLLPFLMMAVTTAFWCPGSLAPWLWSVSSDVVLFANVCAWLTLGKLRQEPRFCFHCSGLKTTRVFACTGWLIHPLSSCPQAV